MNKFASFLLGVLGAVLLIAWLIMSLIGFIMLWNVCEETVGRVWTWVGLLFSGVPVMLIALGALVKAGNWMLIVKSLGLMFGSFIPGALGGLCFSKIGKPDTGDDF